MNWNFHCSIGRIVQQSRSATCKYLHGLLINWTFQDKSFRFILRFFPMCSKKYLETKDSPPKTIGSRKLTACRTCWKSASFLKMTSAIMGRNQECLHLVSIQQFKTDNKPNEIAARKEKLLRGDSLNWVVGMSPPRGIYWVFLNCIL